jgi:hypothetical protein
MTAPDTGYDAAGMSPMRIAYTEAWGHWHINELRAKRKPFMPLDLLAERRFPVPKPVEVPKKNIEMCLQAEPGVPVER